MDDLLPIGRFAKATRLSVKALRHYDELGRRGLEPAGPLQVVYHADQVLDEDSVAPIEICFPVAAAFEGTGQVYGTELPGGPAAVTLHRGPMPRSAPPTTPSPAGSPTTATS